MLRLQQRMGVDRTQQIVAPSTNYSREQINDLFQLGRFTPVLLYKSKAKRLFDLGLSIDDSKYLIQTKGLSVDEIVKCISELKLDVQIIRQLSCSNSTLFSEIPSVLTMVGGVDILKPLIGRGLSIENIKTIFGQLKLSYDDVTSLMDCGYKICEIKALVEEKYSCTDLVALAKIIKASEETGR